MWVYFVEANVYCDSRAWCAGCMYLRYWSKKVSYRIVVVISLSS
jgi:hypothetical protein